MRFYVALARVAERRNHGSILSCCDHRIDEINPMRARPLFVLRKQSQQHVLGNSRGLVLHVRRYIDGKLQTHAQREGRGLERDARQAHT